ncbi:MAG: hypothetical protein EB127_06835 [Alphaproteobacteria bacterium]|nr:hypothetical protein [Alphaproteobacteria bacterium]
MRFKEFTEGKLPPRAGFNPKPMKKGPGDSPDDYEYTAFIPRGKEAGEEWAIKQTIAKQKLPKQKPKSTDTGFYKNYLGNRPIRESEKETASEVEKFKDWACKKLHVKNPPKIELSYDTEEAQQGHHTGRHVEGSDSVWVYAANRNLVDILRTVFHELVHVRQSELNIIKHGDSYPGSPIEAMADMLAGKYIKIYGKQNRNIFQ